MQRHTEVASIYCFTSLMPATARAEPSCSQECRTPSGSPKAATGTPLLEHHQLPPKVHTNKKPWSVAVFAFKPRNSPMRCRRPKQCLNQ